MNTRILAASLLSLGLFTSGAFAAGGSDFIQGPMDTLSDDEKSYAIGRNLPQTGNDVDLQGLVEPTSPSGSRVNGDFIDEPGW
jgi:hypothetical protein